MHNENLILDVKALHNWYCDNNINQENGGFFTFGDKGLHCCNSLKAINVYRFFLKVFNVDFTA